MIIVQWIHSLWTTKLSDDLLEYPVWCPVEISDGDKCDFITTVPLGEHGFLSLCLNGRCVTKRILYPQCTYPLLSWMTCLKFTASAFILTMKYKIVIYDPILWLSRFILLSGCLQKLHQFLLPLRCLHMPVSTPKQACHLILKLNQGIRLQLKDIKSHLLWS